MESIYKLNAKEDTRIGHSPLDCNSMQIQDFNNDIVVFDLSKGYDSDGRLVGRIYIDRKELISLAKKILADEITHK